MPHVDSAAILIEDLGKDYNGTPAVRGIDLAVARGEFFGLLGPNGAGKTTTMAMLTGLIDPTRGRIHVEGVPLSARPLEAKARMGFVPQDFAFYPTLLAVENLRFFGRLYGLRGARLGERIRDVLEAVGLEDRARQTVAAFSNGMMRRLNIAIGLLHEPRVLILDEPTVGVDAHSRNAIYETLARLNRQGVTILYTTHHMEEAQRLCGRVAIMDRGRILTEDTPEALVRRYGEGVVSIELKEAAEEGFGREMAALESVEEVTGEGVSWTLTTREPERAVRLLMARTEPRGVRFRTLSILAPNLESVFLRLTGRGLRDSPGPDAGSRKERP